MKTYVLDIDGTICTHTAGEYEKAEPLVKRIEKINNLYDEGSTIIFFTARGMGRAYNDSRVATKMFMDITLEQLKKWEVKYHKLLLGKPAGDIYVDDKGINDVDFFGD